MGKYLGFLLIVGCVGVATPASAAIGGEASNVSGTVAVQQVRVHNLRLRDEAAMVLVGTALIGLAAAVRRAAA